MITAIANTLNTLNAKFMSGRLGRNVGWLTGAEFISRFGRIIAAVVLARQLDATAFGIAAIAITVFELVRVFTENGIGAAVVRATKQDFHQIANTAHRLMWVVCIGLAVSQLLIGFVVEAIVPGQGLGAMIAVLSGVFLIMPFGLMHAYCLQREERMKHLAIVGSSQAVVDHVLTAILALSGFGAWAIVLPKLLTVPIWLIGVTWSRPWKRQASAGFASSRAILSFSLPVLGAELLSAFRDHLDKLAISLTLGIDALGIYYFAFNAGLGVSSALNRAFSSAVYPHFCAARDKAAAYRKAISGLGILLGSAYIFQAAAALLYVPIVFGASWAHAAPLVAVLCLGGPARLFVDAARMQIRAEGYSGRELRIALGLSVSVLAPFCAAAPFGLMPAAIASVVGACVYASAITLMRLDLKPSIISSGAGAQS